MKSVKKDAYIASRVDVYTRYGVSKRDAYFTEVEYFYTEKKVISKVKSMLDIRPFEFKETVM